MSADLWWDKIMNDNSRGKLAGRVAIVTGGSRGIGAAIADAFAVEGAAVALVHLGDTANAEQVVSRLRRAKIDCIQVECDVSREDQVRDCLDAVRGTLGSVDILVNCAGIGHLAKLEEQTLEQWERVIAVNLTGTYLMSAQCYPDMTARGWGRIINVSSQMAFSGGVGASAYCASKAGVIGFTRALAVEAAPHGVLVNCIAPGATQTDMLDACGEDLKAGILAKIPLGRFGTPQEIAPLAVLLASDEGSFFVGQTISPNGGDVLG
jgi:3-oxoacyl-[acyl-carrier protein] reductase